MCKVSIIDKKKKMMMMASVYRPGLSIIASISIDMQASFDMIDYQFCSRPIGKLHRSPYSHRHKREQQKQQQTSFGFPNKLPIISANFSGKSSGRVLDGTFVSSSHIGMVTQLYQKLHANAISRGKTASRRKQWNQTCNHNNSTTTAGRRHIKSADHTRALCDLLEKLIVALLICSPLLPLGIAITAFKMATPMKKLCVANGDRHPTKHVRWKPSFSVRSVSRRLRGPIISCAIGVVSKRNMVFSLMIQVGRISQQMPYKLSRAAPPLIKPIITGAKKMCQPLGNHMPLCMTRFYTGIRSQNRFYTTGVNQKSVVNKRGRASRIFTKIKEIQWYWIPPWVGIVYIALKRYGYITKREKSKQELSQGRIATAKHWQVSLYRLLPLRLSSRVWGNLNNVAIPERLRTRVISWYIRTFDCNLEEAAVEDLKHYKNLGEFFRRSLKPSVRPINQYSSVVSPSDGTLLHAGRIQSQRVEQVKGVTYSLNTFLGPQFSPAACKQQQQVTADSSSSSLSSTPLGNNDYKEKETMTNIKELLQDPEKNSLYQCVIYLAPGDYHRFHSPGDWIIHHRRHFPGDLLSVSPGIARWVAGLFNYNERVVLTGRWKHGFFSMAAVGATNVGSIRVYFDKYLQTNQHASWQAGDFYDRDFLTPSSSLCGIHMRRGEPCGEFNLGSTMVCIFEAPHDFEFSVKPGEKVLMGQALGILASETRQDSKNTPPPPGPMKHVTKGTTLATTGLNEPTR